jgi:hypothetical protein
MEYKTLESKIKESALQVDEAPLIMNDRDIFESITDKLKIEFDKQLKKNPEKALALMKSLGSLVGYGVTKSNQSKGKTFRYELKKK